MIVQSMRILFVCVGNTCRSQMAEGLARELGHEASSAGIEPGARVAGHAVAELAELGIDIAGNQPKSVADFDEASFDKVIGMGCGVSARDLRLDEDWGLEDPHLGSIEKYRSTRDEIRHRLADLSAQEA